MIANECVVVAYGYSPNPDVSGDWSGTIFIYRQANRYDRGVLVESFSGIFSQEVVNQEISRGLSVYTYDYSLFQWNFSFLETIRSDDDWKIWECDIANRVQYRQRVYTRELVNSYLVSFSQEKYNTVEPDFVNIVYIVRRDDFSGLVGKTKSEVESVLPTIKENILLLTEESQNNNILNIWGVYNKRLYPTVYNSSNDFGIVKRVFQIWDIEEVQDMKQTFEYSFEGSILFNNIDNEIILR